MEQLPPQVSCPKCGSHEFHANKKGFSGKKAVAGAVLTGGIGLLAGTIGSNKVTITCLNCGNQFSPGAKAVPPKPQAKVTKGSQTALVVVSIVFGILFLFMTIGFASQGSWIAAIFWGFVTLVCIGVVKVGRTEIKAMNKYLKKLLSIGRNH